LQIISRTPEGDAGVLERSSNDGNWNDSPKQKCWCFALNIPRE
jgi:hypothetical protein